MLRESGVVKKSVVEDGRQCVRHGNIARRRKLQEQKTQPVEGTQGATKSEICKLLLRVSDQKKPFSERETTTVCIRSYCASCRRRNASTCWRRIFKQADFDMSIVETIKDCGAVVEHSWTQQKQREHEFELGLGRRPFQVVAFLFE